MLSPNEHTYIEKMGTGALQVCEQVERNVKNDPVHARQEHNNKNDDDHDDNDKNRRQRKHLEHCPL